MGLPAHRAVENALHQNPDAVMAKNSTCRRTDLDRGLGHRATTGGQSGADEKGRANEVLARQAQEKRMQLSLRLETDRFRDVSGPQRLPRVALGTKGSNRVP